MYIPSAFNVHDPELLAAFMQQNNFATLITCTDGVPFASHLPLLFDPHSGPSGTLLGHMAKANPQWQHFAPDRELLIIFHGPHAYISPNYYESQPAVPTWNYATVHAYGTAQIISDGSALADIVQKTVTLFEGTGPNAWKTDISSTYNQHLLTAIVGFQIPITRIEGKFKLGQNRSKADIAGVHTALSHSSDPQSRALADLMLNQKML